MTEFVPTLFALMCAGAGWYYVVHAGSASKLGAFEREADNRLRIRLRRWGGAGLVLIGVAFYVAFRIAQRPHANPVLVSLCLLSILILLPIVLFLAWVDLRLTRKMREANERKRLPPK